MWAEVQVDTGEVPLEGQRLGAISVWSRECTCLGLEAVH